MHVKIKNHLNCYQVYRVLTSLIRLPSLKVNILKRRYLTIFEFVFKEIFQIVAV